MDRRELNDYLDGLLDCGNFKDYCPNGMQVEGRLRIATIVTGVTASEALIRAAIALNADAIIVHHGYFWRGEDMRVIGQKKKRLQWLLGHDLNLYAYHLPLDAHAELGNNVQLARVLGLESTDTFGEQGLCHGGNWDGNLGELAARIDSRLGRKPLLVGDPERPVRRIAWCTGAAQGMLQDAIDAGAEAFISGEISEPTAHLAREMGVAYLAAGHHATERYGIQALGDHLARVHGLDCHFVDIDNPA